MFATALIADVPSVDLSLLLSFLQTLFSFISLIKSMEDNHMTNSKLVGSGARSGPNFWGNLSGTFQALCRFDTCPFHFETAIQQSHFLFHLSPRFAWYVYTQRNECAELSFFPYLHHICFGLYTPCFVAHYSLIRRFHNQNNPIQRLPTPIIGTMIHGNKIRLLMRCFRTSYTTTPKVSLKLINNI